MSYVEVCLCVLCGGMLVCLMRRCACKFDEKAYLCVL